MNGGEEGSTFGPIEDIRYEGGWLERDGNTRFLTGLPWGNIGSSTHIQRSHFDEKVIVMPSRKILFKKYFTKEDDEGEGEGGKIGTYRRHFRRHGRRHLGLRYQTLVRMIRS